MVNIEKQLAMSSETASTDVEEEMDLDININGLDEADRELQVEEENHILQTKKIVEVDNVIAEKEEILTKLLDTVRGYSAMKVSRFHLIFILLFTFITSITSYYLLPCLEADIVSFISQFTSSFRNEQSYLYLIFQEEREKETVLLFI